MDISSFQVLLRKDSFISHLWKVIMFLIDLGGTTTESQPVKVEIVEMSIFTVIGTYKIYFYSLLWF